MSEAAKTPRAYGTKRQAILDAALDLFNEQGVGAVSTNHIAAAVGISPGNLYYHFRDKADIAWDLFQTFGTALAEVLTGDAAADMAELYRGFFNRTLALVWTYRFVFHDHAALRRLQPRFETADLAIRAEFLTRAKNLFRALEAGGVFTPGLEPADLAYMADNLWMIGTGWPDLLRADGITALSEQEAARGVRHIFHFLAAYMTPGARRLVRAELADGSAFA